jgi:N-acetyl sugar amidotransferase
MISNLIPQPASGTTICRQCVMDTSLLEVSFDAGGICNFCRSWEVYAAAQASNAERKGPQFDLLLQRIRESGKGKPYDCLIGISGGVDSSYVALKAIDLGLRPLAVQFDNGWNTELAVDNIQRLCHALKLDLRTYVVDWEEFRDVQLAFLKASVRNIEAPTDHAIFAALYKVAARIGLRFILNGNNAATESTVLPRSFGHAHRDARQLRGIHRRFGTRSLRTFPVMGTLMRPYYSHVMRIRSVRLLDVMPGAYVKADAIARLQNEIGWRPYTGKHHESVITRFHQCYILPRKFGVDKRRAHLSNLIHSGQLTRDEALRELQKPPCPPEQLESDRRFVAKKFGLSVAELDDLLAIPERPYTDYPNEDRLNVLTQRLGTLLARAGLL